MLMVKSFQILDMSSPFRLVLASSCQISNVLWVGADFLEQPILYFFSLSTGIKSFLQRALVLFSGEWHLGGNIWVLAVVTATRISLLSTSLSVQSWENNKNYKHTHIHTHIYSCVYLFIYWKQRICLVILIALQHSHVHSSYLPSIIITAAEENLAPIIINTFTYLLREHTIISELFIHTTVKIIPTK